jgi:hypothetical protein
MANLGEIIGAVSVAWQQDVWLVFYHMGLRTDEEQPRQVGDHGRVPAWFSRSTRLANSQ